MFLEPADLIRLTGYRRPSAQVRWLLENGIPHYVDARERPIVIREALVPDAKKRPDLSKLRI